VRADRVRTVLSLRRGLGWKLGLAVVMIGKDSMIRSGRLPMCQGWISRLFLLRIDFWRKGSGEYKTARTNGNETYGFTMKVR
jgi:hypothetical protein